MDILGFLGSYSTVSLKQLRQGTEHIFWAHHWPYYLKSICQDSPLERLVSNSAKTNTILRWTICFCSSTIGDFLRMYLQRAPLRTNRRYQFVCLCSLLSNTYANPFHDRVRFESLSYTVRHTFALTVFLALLEILSETV